MAFLITYPSPPTFHNAQNIPKLSIQFLLRQDPGSTSPVAPQLLIPTIAQCLYHSRRHYLMLRKVNE